jgi:predicted dehydrogenase
MLKRLLPEYGAIRAIDARAGNMGPFRENVPVLWDWGAHDVAMCVDLLGRMPERSEVTHLERRPMTGGMGEILNLTLYFSENVQARICLGNMLPKCRKFAVKTDTGTLEYDDLAEYKLTKTSAVPGVLSDEKVAVPLSAEMPLSIVVKSFAQAVAAKSTCSPSLNLGVSVVRVLAESLHY